MAVATLINVFLYKTSFTINNDKNGFTRLFASAPLKELYSGDVDRDIYKIAGITQSRIFLATLHPGDYIVIDPLSRDRIRSSFGGVHFPYYHTQYQIFIDSPIVTIGTGNFRKIYFGNLLTKKISDSIAIPYTFFRTCIISPHSMGLRVLDTLSTHKLLFIKIKTDPIEQLITKDLSRNKEESGFAGDGLLKYDPTTRQLVYCHFYQSQILLLDTNFNLSYRLHTIDTFNRSFTTGDQIKKGKTTKYTTTSPRYVISSNMAVADGIAYIESKIKSDNEVLSDFRQNSVIDLYNLKSKQYLSSFYIPKRKKEQVIDFAVAYGKLYVLYNDRIVLYSLRT
jgi:hypothetical protein